MRLSISNIGWSTEQDESVYSMMKKYGFEGLEIAPARIFPTAPYDDLDQAAAWANEIKQKHGFTVSSMQSIWFGKQEKLFGTVEERNALIDYTKKAIDFSISIKCKNLVFGCPRNRFLPEGGDPEIGIKFFKTIGDYAFDKGTAIGMEANPPIYNTNYINDTVAALVLIKTVKSPGFLLNLDVGTMIQNDESIDLLEGNMKYINHVHISEPGLKMIERRNLHLRLKDFLFAENYRKFVSIEMVKTDHLQNVENTLAYVKETFG